MTLKDQLDALLDATAFDSTGTKIGAVRQVYVDDANGKITFATVSTGIFSSDAIVPLHGARLLDDELHVDHTRSVIRDSPRPDHTEDALTPEQEAKLLEYYGIDAPVRGRDAAPSTPAGTDAAATGTPATKPPAATAPDTETPGGKATGGKAPGGKAPEKTPGGTTTRSPGSPVGGTDEPEKSGADEPGAPERGSAADGSGPVGDGAADGSRRREGGS